MFNFYNKRNSLLTYSKQIAIYKFKVEKGTIKTYLQFISIKKETIFKHNRAIFKHNFFNKFHKVTIIFLFVIKKSYHDRVLAKQYLEIKIRSLQKNNYY